MEHAAFVADDDVIVTAHADIVKVLLKNRSGETREARLPMHLAVKLWSWILPQDAPAHAWVPQFGEGAGTDRRRRQDRRGNGSRNVASVKVE